MKASYSKPYMALEMFSLSQSVARDCDELGIPKENLTFNDPVNCRWDLGGGITVFMVAHGCMMEGENMVMGCYNNPTEGQYIFRS